MGDRRWSFTFQQCLTGLGHFLENESSRVTIYAFLKTFSYVRILLIFQCRLEKLNTGIAFHALQERDNEIANEFPPRTEIRLAQELHRRCHRRLANSNEGYQGRYPSEVRWTGSACRSLRYRYVSG